jgi:hypothetical protein
LYDSECFKALRIVESKSSLFSVQVIVVNFSSDDPVLGEYIKQLSMTFPAVKLLTYGAKDEEQVTKIMKIRKNVAVECVEKLEQKFEIDEEHFKEV